MKSPRKLQKHTLCLYEGQFERLQRLNPEAGATHIIRLIVDAYLDKIDPPMNAEEIHQLDKTNVTEIL